MLFLKFLKCGGTHVYKFNATVKWSSLVKPRNSKIVQKTTILKWRKKILPESKYPIEQAPAMQVQILNKCPAYYILKYGIDFRIN